MSENSYGTERPRDESTGATGGWHGVDVGHLVMGVAFLGLTVVWALRTADVVDVERHGWMLGLPWLIGGAVGLVASALAPRRTPRAQQTWKQEWTEQLHTWKDEQKRAHREWKHQMHDWKRQHRARPQHPDQPERPEPPAPSGQADPSGPSGPSGPADR